MRPWTPGFLALFALVFWMPAPAVAAGYAAQCGGEGTLPSAAVGTITAPVNVAPGTTLGTTQGSFLVKCYWLSGSGDLTNKNEFQANGSPVSGYTNIYPTNIAGLGVRYTVDAPQCGASGLVLSSAGKTAVTCSYPGLDTNPVKRSVNVKVEFVATGNNLGTGTLTTIPSIQYWVTPSDGTTAWAQPDPFSGSASGTVSSLTCSINTRDVSVALEKAAAQDMPSVGSTVGVQSFQLSLTCPAGIKVAMTLSDSVTPANRTSTVTLAPASTAKGIGIQIINKDANPILMGPDSPAAGNMNQWVVGSSVPGTFNIPLAARYIRTGTISGGTVKALVTYTMSYQ
ncbi:fimbrial protein [Variovorax robiniae]|uniref:Fimbrial protein n=1 Tax=Variovorax robiniae TaxID=1836199 RepID=A0ABU8X9T9_9BURK